MKQIERLVYQDIPSFISENKREHDVTEFLELAELVKKSGEWEEPLQKLQKKSRPLKSMSLEEALRTLDTPYLSELLQQRKERDRLEQKLMDLWERPLNENGFTGKSSARDIFFKQRELMIRYLNINLVIQSDVKEYVINNQNPGRESMQYRNFRSYWYNEVGEKRMSINFSYGKIEDQNGKNSGKDDEQNLLEMLRRFYKQMNYSYDQEPIIKGRGRNYRPDLIVRKGNKEWVVEIKKSHAGHYKTMILNYHLWLQYCQTYILFNKDADN